MAVYKKDIVDIELNSGNVHRSFLKHSLGKSDTNADHFGIRVFRGGEPVDLSDVSVQGFFKDPKGTNIAITSGNIVGGNQAEVVLPQACYNYEGQFCLAIKLVGGGVTGTMRIVDGMIDNTNTGSAVAPTGAVPTYQEVLASYDAAIAAVDDVNKMKSAMLLDLDALYKGQYREYSTSIYEGGINTSGGNLSNSARARTGYTAIVPGETYHVKLEGLTWAVMNAWVYSGTTQGTAIRRLDLNPDKNDFIFTAETNENYLRVAFYYSADSTHVITADERTDIKNKFRIRRTTDRTLMIQNAAADAEETGKRIYNTYDKATQLFLNLNYDNLMSFNSPSDTNKRNIKLVKNSIIFSVPSGVDPTGGTWYNYIISKGPRFISTRSIQDYPTSGFFDGITTPLTSSEFTSFDINNGSNLQLMMTVDFYANDTLGNTDGRVPPYIVVATYNNDTDEITYTYSSTTTFRGSAARTYRINLTDRLPEIMTNKNIAVFFGSTRPCLEGIMTVDFSFFYDYQELILEKRIGESTDSKIYSKATPIFLNQQYANLQSMNNPHENNKRIIKLDKNRIYFEPATETPIGVQYYNYLISKTPRYIGDQAIQNNPTHYFDNVTLTEDDFTSFDISDNTVFQLIMTVDMYEEDTLESGENLVQPYFVIATYDAEDEDDPVSYVYTSTATFNGSAARTYRINLTDQLPDIMTNKNLAIFFGSTRTCIKGNISVDFSFLYDYEVKPLSTGWENELSTCIDSINTNIISAGETASTVCFVTDVHWLQNKHKSPRLIKRIIDSCNIGFFVNGGDVIKDYNTGGKIAAMKELNDYLNEIRSQNIRLPMILLYGNHDRNRNLNPDRDDPTKVMTRTEHLMLSEDCVALNYYNITRLKDTEHTETVIIDGQEVQKPYIDDCLYWEDENYRYAAIYWYNSSNHPVSWAAELFDTEKPVVIFYHGIYISISTSKANDNIQGQWLLNVLEPYKNQIRCIIQGHAHQEGLRYAYDVKVPILIIDADMFIKSKSKAGQITEQTFAVITIEREQIKVVKVGRGADYTVDADTPERVYNYGQGRFDVST